MHDHNHDKPKPKGLKLRGEIWWIDKIIRVGDQTIELRESTRCRALSDASVVLNRRIEEVTRPLYVQAAPGERTFAEAAAEYIADLERRGKSSERQLYALALVMPEIEGLPLKRIHQRTLQPWIDRQKGVRSSSTVGRTLQTVSTVLHYAATVLMDDEGEPWLKRVPPRLSAPDWGARQPRPISWEEQDRLGRGNCARLTRWCCSLECRMPRLTTEARATFTAAGGWRGTTRPLSTPQKSRLP